MKIAIVGATGRAGSRIAAEAVRRGHEVTGIARRPVSTQAPPGVRLVAGDATQPASVAGSFRGQDAVVSAARFLILPAPPLLHALRSAGVKRLLVVGGAATLEIQPGKALLDLPTFPEEYRAEATAGRKFLEDLREVRDLDWTFLSPAADFEPGERTGKFRLGLDQFLTDSEGRSRISMEDYAIAALDELEHPRHVKRRFAVAY
jgi:uncharacterized protein